VIRLDKVIRRQGKVTSLETRYFVSSLDPDVVPAKEIQAYIRGHWEVENCLHWQKDRYDDEDKHVLRLPGLGDAWTLLTSIALSLGRLLWAIVSTQFFLELVFVVLGNFDKMGGMIFPSTFPTNG